jgi:hypothetical protein
MNRQTQCNKDEAPLTPGTGALCAEAQADGVPCYELGRDCQVCGRAMARSEREPPELPRDMA